MIKRIVKILGILVLIVLTLAAAYNVYRFVRSGNQNIKISTPTKAFSNSDLYVSIIAQDNNVDLDTKTKLELFNSKGKKVKNTKTKYDGSNVVISIPEIESGNYFLEAKVSSKAGKDTVKKEIYISDENLENVTITLDKGIYKPGDTINYRALLTKKENDEPISQDINVCIYDGNDNKVYNETIKTSEYGIVSGNFSLANEVNSGLYKLIVKTKNNETTKQFKVNPYITPKYEVKINYDKKNYLVGEKAKITFNAKYFFGEAVKDAELNVYMNNEKCETLKTDSKGNATLEYEIKEAKTYNVKIEAVDSSNYYVEASSSFVAGTDIFEVELLPEYGSLINGKRNDVYVFTKKADGTPIKTYVTINSNNYTKQIATDENGIGKFSIDIDVTNNKTTPYHYNYNYYSTNNIKTFSIAAEDTDGNKVKKNLNLNIEKKELLMSTNKVKYNQGEDIKINISSTSENSKNVYLFKSEKLIKMISTDLEETTINLEDTYGLIDIYVTDNKNNNKSFKKTIFIKPTKQLTVDITTDKSEYKPGENIGISFNSVDENKTGVDAALLVSMLDNSVLNLANNDLSIDNIKLALQDIKFSDELDGATLYSCIVDEKSEQTIMALLLKQSSKDISVSETSTYNTEQKEKHAITATVLTILLIIVFIIILCIKNKKFKEGIKHLINFIIYDLVLVIAGVCLIEEFFIGSEYTFLTFVITTVIGLATYIALISKLHKKIFRTSISIIISALLIGLWYFIVEVLGGSSLIICLILALLILAFVILAKISNAKKLKIDKYIRIIVKEIIYILKYIGALVIVIFITAILQEIIGNFSIPIAIICLYFLNYLFNKSDVETIEEVSNNQDTRIKGKYILIALAIIGVLAIVHTLRSASSGLAGSFDYDFSSRSIGDGVTIDSMESDIRNDRIDIMGAKSIDSDASTNNSVIGNLFSSFKNDTKSEQKQEEGVVNKEEKEAVTDTHIRNVFLESMCFIPELITNNGNAKVDLKLSDNITTWTIQTIGNTKDGRIGYGMLNNVKVFKDFFVDFELPKNLVETDNVSIPVTVHNYTDKQISTALKVKEEEWFKIDNSNISVNVDAKGSKMTYIPISIIKNGNNKFRVEVEGNGLTDIVEKECNVSTKGYKVEKVVSTGSLDKDISEDLLILEDIIENTAKAKVKIYSSTMAQTIEGMENIFRMPTGCFEQISSSLYPNILALKYLEDNKISNEKIKTKALSYISSGYQKLLTYEVKGESGGYSLYGQSPAETVLTAYGLMEITDLNKVYSVDNNVIEKMTNFLYKKQNINGTFQITGHHTGGAGLKDTLSLNAYITWALSESNPNDGRLKKSVDYLKGKLKDIDDNYTLALVANILANVKDKELNDVLKRLVNNVKLDGKKAYITSNISDYYGSRYDTQTIQSVALASMALSKGGFKEEINKLFINYLISKKDISGTWNSTQATILALKALNERNEKAKLGNQAITVKVNSDEQKIEIKDNPLELYELTFDRLNKENKLRKKKKKGSAYYEVIEEYYIPYEKVDTKEDNIEITVESNNELKVNEILKSKINAINRSENTIVNGMITIAIPQGFTVVEESLMQLHSKGIIEKYETSYTSVNIYLRNFDVGQVLTLEVLFRAGYPVKVTGMNVRAYDYYNPTVEGKTMPVEIVVKN